MYYFSFSQLKDRFGNQFDFEQIDSFLPQVNNPEKQFLAHLKTPNAVIFLGWIERMTGLEKLLKSRKTDIQFRDELKVLEHVLVDDFKRFVTPMLAPIILNDANAAEISKSFSYLPLLDSDTRAVVEDQVYKLIALKFEAVNGLKDKEVGEEKLIEATQIPLNDEVIEIINQLSRQSYALKLNYVDAVLGIVNAKSCTLRLANWILKQLEKLTLNAEHNEKINELRRDLKAGNISVQNTNSHKGKSIPFRTILMAVFIFGLIGTAIYLWIYQPWSIPVKPDLVNNSSFVKFTRDERKEIDSLLKIIQPKRDFSNDELDLGTYMAEELELILRVSFKNEIAEKYYQDLNIVARNADQLRKDTCIANSEEKIKKLVPTNMRPMDQKTEGNKAYIKNESDYDVQIVVFRNFYKSEVYHTHLKQGGKAVIMLDIGEWFVVVPGKTLQSFALPKGYSGGEPSKDFNVNFCELDINFGHGINTSYILNTNSRVNYKFLLVGSPTEQFEVVDIHGVLDIQ